MGLNQVVQSELYHSSPCSQFIAQEYALITGKLPLEGLLRNSVVGITRCPDMITAVDRKHKLSNNSINRPTNQTEKF